MSETRISPVLQFVLLIVPTVMTGFYMVYALVGLLLEDRDKANWAIEAAEVSVWVGSTIALFSVLVLVYTRFKGLPAKHLLALSGWTHLIIAVLLTITVFVIL